MDFVTAVKTALGKFATFEGRARRAEYWYFFLFNMIVAAIALVLDDAMFGGEITPFYVVATLVLLLPNIGLNIRRLHDLDRSGWWYLVILIPLVGFIVLIVWACMRGTQGPNRFGDDPVAETALTTA